MERPFAIVAQPLGELVEGAHGGLRAIDVGALELVAAGGQRLLERPERLRYQVLGEPLGVPLAGDTEALGRERRQLPALAVRARRLAHALGAVAEVVEQRLA